ncbi:MAG: class I SAM-dependent methyltransferase [Desulfobacteraceae bacterium]|jgi:23S rRNA (cytosine1962-C5)-methyltransferase
MGEDRRRAADPEAAERYRNQAAMLANKVLKRYRHLRKRFARENIEVFRLYDWDIPEIRAVVDWYGGHLVIGEYTRTQSTPEWLPLMGAAVAQALGVPRDKLHLKQRRAGFQGGRRYRRLDFTNRRIVVAERDFRFYVNPYDYIDTGLFADHRNTRQMIREASAGKDFLNLFCYTGTFSCYAARGGARTTVSVDRAETAIQWARENMALNAIPEAGNSLVQAHADDFLKSARRRQQRFDLAVVDPPSYSTTRGRREGFDILRDHPLLLAAVAALMRPGGTIWFSTNHQDFTLAMDRLAVAAVDEITAVTIPEDYRSKRKTIHRCWKITV